MGSFSTCCELISNCIFTWAITRRFRKSVNLRSLWIDFKLYFYVSNHKEAFFIFIYEHVVNWFQIVFLREQSQVSDLQECQGLRCELISNCIFTWAITSSTIVISILFMLWIDFKLYFYVSNHKSDGFAPLWFWVVNWFQIVFLREQSQVS